MSLGQLLAVRRRELFVGRTAELELFRAALDTDDPPFRVLFLHGPGGVGKSSLLDAMADTAEGSGAALIRVDGQDSGGPVALEESVRADLQPANAGRREHDHEARHVVLIDGFEWLEAVEGWVRDELLPALPASALTVIASRRPPSLAWRSDGAWTGLLRTVSLRNLDADSARRYLELRGVPSDRHDDVLAVTHAHPLAVSLVADVLAERGDLDLSELPVDLVGGLLERLVSAVPSSLHLSALGVSAVARMTTERLLADVMGDAADAHELFGWLAGLGATELRTDGVRPHDLVRDLLDADLRWRDPETYRTVFRAVSADAVARAGQARGRSQQRAVADVKYLFRNVRGVLSPVSWQEWGDHYPDLASPADKDSIVQLLRDAEGEESGELGARWFDLQPEAFHVVRTNSGQVRGLVALLDLTAAEPSDRSADPGTAAAWAYAQTEFPVREEDSVTQCRFIVDALAYQGPSPTLNAVPILTLQHQLVDRHLAWDFLTLADPDRWNDYFAVAGMPRAVGADFAVGDRHYGLFAHDFRQVPIEAVVQRWTEVALADDALALPLPDTPTESLVLSHGEFADAVRQALRDLHRPDLLGRNPLVRAQLVERAVDRYEGLVPVAVLDDLLRQAVASLADDPREDRLWRAVDRTYLGGTRTQEGAAAALDLPFSTYRRHLRQGTERVVEWLWRRELGDG